MRGGDDMDIIDAKDINWEEASKENAKFLAKAIDRINMRINEKFEKNGRILQSEMHKIVFEELGLDLHNYDVNFMESYIDHSQSECD
jgi:hypothetical protein